MSTPQFRGDLAFSEMLAHSATKPPTPAAPGASTLPDAELPRLPKALQGPGLEAAPDKRIWSGAHIYRKMRGRLSPYIRSGLLPGDFHPITAHFFVQYKCNLDWWYCWAFDNRVNDTSEDVARRSQTEFVVF